MVKLKKKKIKENKVSKISNELKLFTDLFLERLENEKRPPLSSDNPSKSLKSYRQGFNTSLESSKRIIHEIVRDLEKK